MFNLFSSKPRPVAEILSGFQDVIDELVARANAALEESKDKHAEAVVLEAKADALVEEYSLAIRTADNISKLIGKGE
jgi:alanine-alpha-ketoisovalerate/valine-pyruvate aminotransferase